MRIHFIAAFLAIASGIYFRLSLTDWTLVLLCIGGVVSMECMNTAIERLADRVTEEDDPLIAKSKDCAAAAVLIAALVSATVGACVFAPKIWVMLD